MKRRFVFALAIAALSAASAVPVSGQGPSLAMLDGLQKGSWELRVRGESSEARKICLRDGRQLIQLRHKTENCRRLVVEDTSSQVTVQYTCPGNGYGRTRIRRETPQLLQIDTQGIADGAPFAFAAEARWVGRCSP